MRGSSPAAGGGAWAATGGTSSSGATRLRRRELARFDMFQIVTRSNAVRPPERRVVEVDPGFRLDAVGKRHPAARTRVQAAVRIVGPIPLDVIQRRHHGVAVGHLVNLAPDAPFRRGY